MYKKNRGYLQEIIWYKLYLLFMYMPSRNITHFPQSCPSPLFLLVKTFSFHDWLSILRNFLSDFAHGKDRHDEKLGKQIFPFLFYTS